MEICKYSVKIEVEHVHVVYWVFLATFALIEAGEEQPFTSQWKPKAWRGGKRSTERRCCLGTHPSVAVACGCFPVDHSWRLTSLSWCLGHRPPGIAYFAAAEHCLLESSSAFFSGILEYVFSTTWITWSPWFLSGVRTKTGCSSLPVQWSPPLPPDLLGPS